MLCKSCGAEISDNAANCPNCGSVQGITYSPVTQTRTASGGAFKWVSAALSALCVVLSFVDWVQINPIGGSGLSLYEVLSSKELSYILKLKEGYYEFLVILTVFLAASAVLLIVSFILLLANKRAGSVCGMIGSISLLVVTITAIIILAVVKQETYGMVSTNAVPWILATVSIANIPFLTLTKKRLTQAQVRP